MKKRTTTKQLNSAITNNLLKVQKAKLYHKDSGKIDIITDSFVENLAFLSESGCFTDCIGWTFEKDFKTGNYIAECSRTDGNSENIVTVHLSVGDGVNAEEINEILRVI